MQSFFLGVDVSKGYADFVILDDRKQPVLHNFQLDDTSKGHEHFFEIISHFLQQRPQAVVHAAVESTGGYENNWYHCLQGFSQSLSIRVARLNPLGVMHNSKADLKRNTTDKISARSIAEYLIAHPVFKTSGDGSSGFRMSKMGRKEPRRILFMTAITAIRCNPLIRDVYQQHQERGKCKMAAIGVCMHKILRIIYGMLKYQKPFDPQIDIKNRQRDANKTTAPSDSKNRRFQQFDPQAPISRRQNKKRLERKEPQCVDNTMRGVIAPVPEPAI